LGQRDQEGEKVKSIAGTLAAPFPYFGGKSGACEQVWQAFGAVDNYVEAFAGSAAMLLGAPDGKRVETINDFDGFVANFWRAIAADPEAVAHHADWPCNEVDLFARHLWLVRQTSTLTQSLHADPEWFDAKIAGWWCWGACNWIGSGWCSGTGPWVHDGERIVDSRQLPHLGNAGQGINRKLPHLGNAGQGINRKLPHLGNAGRGINRQLPHLGNAGRGIKRKLPHLSAGRGINRATDGSRREYIFEWFGRLHGRLRDVRVTCGDWSRVVKDSVTTRHGLTGVFLDPPYTKGAMDYGAGGMGQGIADDVRAWCAANGDNKLLRIVLCGHAGEHDALIAQGWHTRKWTARKGYALTDEAVENSASETIWCSPHCQPERGVVVDLFAEAA
jgi:site-specific DNA-adenine methylase